MKNSFLFIISVNKKVHRYERFGKKVPVDIVDDEHFKTSVEVSLGPTFYAWVVSFGGKMKIVAPKNATFELKVLIDSLIIDSNPKK